MKYRVFLDTNVFIYSFEFPDSNNSKIIDLLNEGEIEAIISERVLKEIVEYFKRKHSANLANKFRRYLLDTCIIVINDDLAEQINKLKGKIKEKDIEQLATTKKYGIKFLISYDRDFLGFEEYLTPKKFLEVIGIKTSENEF